MIFFSIYVLVHHILTYVDDVNLIGHDMRTIERNSDVLSNNKFGVHVFNFQ